MLIIIGLQDFQVKCAASKIVPLRMDIIIVNSSGKFKLRILSFEKRRFLILFTHVNMAPVIIWFNVVHGLMF
jgi:hypothetical protein